MINKNINLIDKLGQSLLLKSEKQLNCLSNLNKYIKRQLTESTCSISSLSVVCNSWYISSNNVLTDSKILPFGEEDLIRKLLKIKGCSQSFDNGLTMQEFSVAINLLFSQNLNLQMKNSFDSLTIEEFRSDVKRSVKSSCKNVVIVNYFMASINESWLNNGHFSPISAYEEESDSILIADTYVPSFWIDLETMFKAMDTIDTSCKMKRGYLILNWNYNLSP